MNVNKIISKINDMNLQSEEDLQEVESVLTEMDNALDCLKDTHISTLAIPVV